MSKPNSANSRWDTNGSNITAPSSGQRDTGIVSGAASISSYFNYLLNQVYLWFAWLDPLFSSSGGHTPPSNVDMAVSGTGGYKHGDRSLFIHGSTGFINTDPTAASLQYAIDDTGFQAIDASGMNVWFPVPLEAGRRIKHIYGYVSTSSTAGNRLLHFMEGSKATLSDDAFVDYGTYSTISTNHAIDALNGANSIASYVLLANKVYHLNLSLKTSDYIHAIEIVYDYP